MIIQFLRSESGVVNVEWVVLTAALVGLGLAMFGVTATGVQKSSTDIEAALIAVEF